MKTKKTVYSHLNFPPTWRQPFYLIVYIYPLRMTGFVIGGFNSQLRPALAHWLWLEREAESNQHLPFLRPIPVIGWNSGQLRPPYDHWETAQYKTAASTLERWNSWFEILQTSSYRRALCINLVLVKIDLASVS